MAHIELSRDKHLIVIAPATADFLAKLAVGIADDLLSTLCLARDCPLVVAPAMNRQMWEHPATQRNVAQLNADRIEVLGPAAGDQACGEVGMGRMLEAIEIATVVTRTSGAQSARRRAHARYGGSDVRSDRRGSRPHQPELGQDGLRRSAQQWKRVQT